MNRHAAFVVSFFIGVATVVACGGSQSAPASDTQDGSTPTPTPGSTTCGSGDCATEGACCTLSVSDGYGDEGYRCAGGSWKSDTSCLPPPPPCPAPLTGVLTRGDGSAVHAACFASLGINGVVAAALTLDSGERVELYFDHVPLAGDALQIIGYQDSRAFVGRPDGGTDDGGAPAATKVGFRIGLPGGFSGFGVHALSLSGRLTVVSIQSDATGLITSLHAKVDAQLNGTTTAAWNGKLVGSW